MEERGFNSDKIFSLENTIDSKEESRMYEEINEKELEKIRLEYQIKEGDTVGIYCGSLYAHKRIDFLMESLSKIKSRLDNFHFIIVGDGVLRPEVLNLIKGNESWIHYAGAKYGREKLIYFKLASFQLIPGLVGLNIIDSFITLTPLITTKNRLHSPEISYLDNYKNGIITENTSEAYTHAIISLSVDRKLQQELIEGCKRAREVYTIENMAQNFYNGIIKILN